MTSLALGISISGKKIQAVEMEKNGLHGVLRTIDEWENMLPSGLEPPGPYELDLFADTLAAFLTAGMVKAQNVSLALDSSSLFIHRIPIEENAPDAAIREQVEWELAQYFPDAGAGAFITDYHRMSQFPSVRLNEVLSVSVRKSVAQSIGKVLKGLGLRLQVVDADHFAAESALRVNYPDSLRRHVALVGIKEERIDISILKNGNLEAYRHVSVHSTEEIIAEVGSLAQESGGVFTIVAYGTALNAELLHGIRQEAGSLVEALNPLRHVAIADSLRVAEHLTTPSYRFASVIGLALRRD